MNSTPDPSDPDAVVDYLREAIEATRTALDDGVSWADTTMDGQPNEPHVWATLVRYWARSVLEQRANPTWELRKKTNAGFELLQGPFVVRALKAFGTGPPAPGPNASRRVFFSQSQQTVLDIGGIETERPVYGANLILDWALGPNRDLLLALSKPKGVWTYRGQPNLEWRQVVRFGAWEGPRFEPAEEDVVVTPRFDLSEIPDEEEGGGA